MKTISRIIIASLLMITSYVSSAQGINFQGVARSSNGTILASSNISLRLSVMSKSVDATPEYVEIKKVVTNAQGIFSIVIGDAVAGSTTGSFSSINWANAPKFLKVEMDPSGGTSYINMGITQLQYVPFSFYSLGVAAGNVTGILPVEKGGTGVGSLADLKTALKITTFDSASILSKIDTKLSKADTTSLSSRIDTKLSKADTASLSDRIDGKMSNSNTTFSSDITVNGLTVGLSGGQFGNSTALGKNALKSNTTGGGNTAIGSNALNLNTTSSGNTALGNNALAKSTGSSNTSIGSDNMPVNTTGSYNTSVGAYSFYNNTTGSNNIGMGRGHLYNNTTGSSNIAIGNDALQYNTSAENNIAIGGLALNKNTTGSPNIGIGVNALYANTTGYNNIGIGQGALTANTTGAENVSIGRTSLFANTTGGQNLAIGTNSLTRNTTGGVNIALGLQALSFNTTGSFNVGISTSALQANTTGSYNIAIGKDASLNSTTAGQNTIIGYSAGLTNTTGSGNTLLGYQTDVSSGTISNATAIGNGAVVSSSNTVQLGNANVTNVKTAGVLSSSKGLLPPKFTAAQRDAIVDPEQGLIIYCYNCGNYGELQVFNGNAWTNACGMAATAALTDITLGLVASFPLDGSPNGTVSNTTINGTANGSVTYTANRKGNANSAMQGGSGYITAPSTIFQFTRTQSFTVSVWFTADAVVSSGRLLSTENSEGNFRISKYDLNNIAVQYGDYLRQDVTNNDWHHLVYTYNNRLEKVYIDNVLIQTNTDAETEALNYGAPFTIGAKAASAFDKWAGKIDDVKVYNRALLPWEVSVLFNQ